MVKEGVDVKNIEFDNYKQASIVYNVLTSNRNLTMIAFTVKANQHSGHFVVKRQIVGKKAFLTKNEVALGLSFENREEMLQKVKTLWLNRNAYDFLYAMDFTYWEEIGESISERRLNEYGSSCERGLDIFRPGFFNLHKLKGVLKEDFETPIVIDENTEIDHYRIV